jgi:hypothetical protein
MEVESEGYESVKRTFNEAAIEKYGKPKSIVTFDHKLALGCELWNNVMAPIARPF